MGRNAAGESFLRGFFEHATVSEFWVQVENAAHSNQFTDAARLAGRSEPVNVVDRNSLASLGRSGMVYFPGPGISVHAYQRGTHGHGSWSLCGITHTTSSARAMDALAELVTAPVQPWDAVICTSRAVQDNVRRVLQAQADYLQERLGITRVVLPRFPVIPLGVHTQDFVFTESRKADARRSLGIDGEEVVVLFMGRLSFHAKAHPLAMYQAIEAAVRHSGKRAVLVECGWHANDFIAKAFAEAAATACPDVRVVRLDGRKPDARGLAWASADIFCSLSDNIQETFGITPIEAMAAGLPVVVSDWDGYRDTVRHEIDGFRIPTLMPGAGFGSDLALRHALEIDTYDMYCGHTCAFVAVDVPAATDAFARLFASPELRRKLGAAGQSRARELFDWAAIMPRYEALWSELSEIRRSRSAGELKPAGRAWPARLDPFDAFAAYPTAQLTPETLLCLSDSDVDTAWRRITAYRKLAMVNFAKTVLPPEDEIRQLIEAASQGACSVGDVADVVSPSRRIEVSRAIIWLVKLDILRIVRGTGR